MLRLLLPLLIGLAPAHLLAQELPLDQVAKLGKQSTGLVIIKDVGEATAFCVHPDGWFVTNHHVIRDAERNQTIQIVMNPSLKNEKAYRARVVRFDRENDLALLRLIDKATLPALQLSPSESLTETDEVVAFGFPLGSLLAVEKNSRPAVSINAGRVTALRRNGKALHFVQIDAVVNPGNSGGPILNRQGKVVGIVVSHIPGRGINQAVPTEFASALLRKPDVQLYLPKLTAGNITEPKKLAASVLGLDGVNDYEVSLRATPEGLPSQEWKMQPDNGQYSVTTRIMEQPAAENPAPVTLVLAEDSYRVKLDTKQTIKFSGKEYPLASIQSYAANPKPTLTLRGGAKLEGSLDAGQKLSARILGEEKQFDLNTLQSLRVTVPAIALPKSLRFTLTVHHQGKQVARQEMVLTAMSEGYRNIDLPESKPVAEADTNDSPLEEVKPPQRAGLDFRLPDKIKDVTLAAGGRLVIFLCAQRKELLVFDMMDKRFIKTIPLDTTDCLIAGTRNRLLVYNKPRMTLIQYDLKNFTRERTQILGTNKISFMTAGYDSDAMVILGLSRSPFDKQSPGVLILSADSLRPIDLEVPAEMSGAQFNPPHVRTSGNGRVITFLEGHRITNYVLTERRFVMHQGRVDTGYAVPNHSGQMILCVKGVFNHKAEKLNDIELSSDPGTLFCYVPATQGNWFLKCHPPHFFNGKPGTAPLIYLGTNPAPVAVLPEMDLSVCSYGLKDKVLSFDKHLVFHPPAKAVLMLADTNDALHLYPVDLDKQLEDRGDDTMLVTTIPPVTAYLGTTLRYAIKVQSKAGNFVYRLKTFPEGMSISDDGILTWKLPNKMDAKEVPVDVIIADKRGETISHKFTLQIQSR
jgi:hypothetical protein